MSVYIFVLSTDINECATNNGRCQQRCSNSLGSYSCYCDPGYVKAGFSNCQGMRNLFKKNSKFWCSSEHPVSYFISHKIRRSQGSYFYFARTQIIAKDIRRLAANSARKQLFTCVIYTNVQWFLHLTNVSSPSLLISSLLPVSRFLSVTSPPPKLR